MKNMMIGEYIGTIEEFIPGRGTYVDENGIYAANIGELQIDREKHTVGVKAPNYPKVIEEGQIVFGYVVKISEKVVVVIATRIQGFDKNVDYRTGIYVSNISDKYIKSTDEAFGLGDIVKAKVTKIFPDMIDISTKGDFGVVKAFCKKCRHPLVLSKKYPEKLECESCGSVEARKISSDYNKVEMF